MVLSIRTRTTMEALSTIIGESYMKIMGYMRELGEEPADAPFTAYYNMEMDNLDVEMGFPVAKPVPEKGEIKMGEIPQGKVVTYMYKGPYTGMEEPYKEILQWIETNGHAQTGVYYEYYLNSPQEVPETELLTKIAIPVK